MLTTRPERPGDISTIRQIHLASFSTSDEADLVDDLRTSGRLLVSQVATWHDQVVGHVAFSPVTASDHVGAGLAPVAVLPEYRRQGIARHLVRDGLKILKSMSIGFVVVLGDPAYYTRLGMRPASAWGLRDAYGGGPAFLAIELREGGLPRDAGLVRYAAEFDRFGGNPN